MREARIVGKTEAELRRAEDWIEYWDQIPAEKKTAGLLVSFVRSNEFLPAGLQTRGSVRPKALSATGAPNLMPRSRRSTPRIASTSNKNYRAT